jgi:hypothetical protein
MTSDLIDRSVLVSVAVLVQEGVRAHWRLHNGALKLPDNRDGSISFCVRHNVDHTGSVRWSFKWLGCALPSPPPPCTLMTAVHPTNEQHVLGHAP